MSGFSSQLSPSVKGAYNAILTLYTCTLDDFDKQLELCLQCLGFARHNKIMKSKKDIQLLMTEYLHLFDQQKAQSFQLDEKEWYDFFVCLDKFLSNYVFLTMNVADHQSFIEKTFLTLFAFEIQDEIAKEDDDLESISSDDQDEYDLESIVQEPNRPSGNISHERFLELQKILIQEETQKNLKITNEEKVVQNQQPKINNQQEENQKDQIQPKEENQQQLISNNNDQSCFYFDYNISYLHHQRKKINQQQSSTNLLESNNNKSDELLIKESSQKIEVIEKQQSPDEILIKSTSQQQQTHLHLYQLEDQLPIFPYKSKVDVCKHENYLKKKQKDQYFSDEILIKSTSQKLWSYKRILNWDEQQNFPPPKLKIEDYLNFKINSSSPQLNQIIDQQQNFLFYPPPFEKIKQLILLLIQNQLNMNIAFIQILNLLQYLSIQISKIQDLIYQFYKKKKKIKLKIKIDLIIQNKPMISQENTKPDKEEYIDDIKIEEEEHSHEKSSFNLTDIEMNDDSPISFSSDLPESKPQENKRKIEFPEEIIKEYKNPRTHPYRFRDYRRDIITKDIIIPTTSIFHQEIFQPKEKEIDVRRKEILINKINRLFELQKNASTIPFNAKLNRIETIVNCSIEILESIPQIPQQPDKLSSTQRKYYLLEDFNLNSTTRDNIFKLLPLFTNLFSRFSFKTEIIVQSFLDNITQKKFLPLNLKITIDSVEKCQDQILIPVKEPQLQFWCIKAFSFQGFGFYIFNPLRVKEIGTRLVQESIDVIEILNFHEKDPRRYRSIKNFSEKTIAETIQSMLPSDIGWIFQYEDIKVKQFIDLTHFMTIDQEKQSIIHYFETFYYQVIILSQIPLFKLGKNFLINGSSTKMTMKKLLRESQLETVQPLFDFFEECVLINAPKQLMKGIINRNQEIKIDFFSKEFKITGTELPKLLNNNIEIRNIQIIV